MAEKKYCAVENKWCASEKSIIALVFAAIVIIALGATYIVNTEKNTPGYNSGPLKLFFASLDKFVIGAAIVVGAFILWISARAYSKIRDAKFLMLMMAFALMEFIWVLKLIDRYYIPGELIIGPLENLIEVVILVFLALAVFFRK